MSLTAEQKARRKLGIGSSEIAAVCGLNPFKSPHAVWLAKRGLVDDDEETDSMWLGHALEGPLAERYAAESGVLVMRDGKTVHHRENNFALATPDYRASADGKIRPWDTLPIVECKVVGWRMEHHWDDSRADGLPPYVEAQCQWQCGVTGASRFVVPVLFTSDARFRVFEGSADPDVFALLLDKASAFWSLVQRGELPDPDATEACTIALAARYAWKPTERLDAGPAELEQLVRIRMAHVERAKASTVEAALAENMIRALIGDERAGFTGDGWKVTWKGDKNGRRSLRFWTAKE